MRVLMVTRPDAGALFGGDLVHAEELARGLRDLHHEVTLVSGPQETDTYAGYDAAHFFNLHTPEFTCPEMERAKASGTVVALSPIFWDARAEWLIALSPTWGRLSARLGTRLALALGRARVRLATRRWTRLNRRALDIADVVMPSGESEIGQLRRLKPALPATRVVPLGIRLETFDPSVSRPFPPALAALGIERYVLVAARVDRHKNQTRFVEALRGMDIPIVLAGEVVEAPIGQACRDQGAIVLGRVPRHELIALYAHARLHALPSFYDVPGLASLEAAAMGCAIVSTSYGTAKDYFGDRAQYCVPGDVASIRTATATAWEAGPDPSLSPFVRERFTWTRAAEKTAAAYAEALASRS